MGEGEGKKEGRKEKGGKESKGKKKEKEGGREKLMGKRDNFITRYYVFKGTLNSWRSQGLNFTWHCI